MISAILGLHVTTSEDGAGWLACFRDLVARGRSRVELVTADARAGRVAAIGATPGGAAGRRCRTRDAANRMSSTPQTSWPWVKALLHPIDDQPDADAVHARFDRVVDARHETLPAVAAHREDARADLLAVTALPTEVWRQSWSNNPNERLNREIRRRTDVVGIVPDRRASSRLVGAVRAEQHDAWADGRRSLGLDVLARAQAVNTSTHGEGDRRPDPARSPDLTDTCRSGLAEPAAVRPLPCLDTP